jgi:hypothetical protein
MWHAESFSLRSDADGSKIDVVIFVFREMEGSNEPAFPAKIVPIILK